MALFQLVETSMSALSLLTLLYILPVTEGAPLAAFTPQPFPHHRCLDPSPPDDPPGRQERYPSADPAHPPQA